MTLGSQSIVLNNLNLRYQRFTTYGCKDVERRKSYFVAKTQFQLTEATVHKPFSYLAQYRDDQN